MTDHPIEIGPATKDRSRLAGNYLFYLGLLQLITCNLFGLLFMWFGVKVGRRNETFRMAALWLCGLYLLGGILSLLWVVVYGIEGVTLDLWLIRIEEFPPWVAYAGGVFWLIVFGMPFYWLWGDTYKR